MPDPQTNDVQAHLQDGRVLHFPAGTSPDVVQAAVKQTIGATPANWTDEPLGRVAKGFLSEGWNTVNPMNLWQAANHPIDTAKGLLHSSQDQLRQAIAMGQAGEQGPLLDRLKNIGGAMGHGIAAAIPGIGPEAASIVQQANQSGDYARGVGRAGGLAGGMTLLAKAIPGGSEPTGPAGALTAAEKAGLRAKGYPVEVIDRLGKPTPQVTAPTPAAVGKTNLVDKVLAADNGSKLPPVVSDARMGELQQKLGGTQPGPAHPSPIIQAKGGIEPTPVGGPPADIAELRRLVGADSAAAQRSGWGAGGNAPINAADVRAAAPGRSQLPLQAEEAGLNADYARQLGSDRGFINPFMSPYMIHRLSYDLLRKMFKGGLAGGMGTLPLKALQGLTVGGMTQMPLDQRPK